MKTQHTQNNLRTRLPFKLQVSSISFYKWAFLFLICFCKVSNSCCQVILGPEIGKANQKGTYRIKNPNPDISYQWTITNGSGNVNPVYLNNQEIDVIWANNNSEKKIEVKEEPIFQNNSIDVTTVNPPAIAGDGNDDNLAFQTAIDAMAAAGGGTVLIPSGVFDIYEVLLKEGVKIQGAGNNVTFVRRHSSCTTAGNVKKVMTTYYSTNSSYKSYSYLTGTNNIDSRPIEITGITFDGNLPGITTYAYEQQACIFLQNPTEVTPVGGCVLLNNFCYCPIGYTWGICPNINPPVSYFATGEGRLKVFVNECKFINSGGDGVQQHENVNLTYLNCSTESVFRGPLCITGAGGISRVDNLITNSTDPEQHGLDFEVDIDALGINDDGYRVWINNSNFETHVDLRFDKSKVLLTGNIINHKIRFKGEAGDLISIGNTYNFTTDHNYNESYLLGPMCAKFKDDIFNITSDNVGGFHGINYRHYTGYTIYGANLGFNNCTMNALNFGVNDPRHFIYYYKNNDASIAKFYFQSNTNNGFNSDLFPCIYLANTCPDFAFNYNPLPNVYNPNTTLNCGESEDEMKSYFGFKTVKINEEFDCNTTLRDDPNVILLDNPTASEILHFYGNNGVVSNKKFYICGMFVVDEDITFANNCELNFTFQDPVVLQDFKTLTINHSTLQAACTLWKGIQASGSTQKVKIENYSYIKNALTGVNISDNALAEIVGSTFTDNMFGLQFSRMSNDNYQGIITGNIFTHTNNGNGPSGIGIYLTDISKLVIGNEGNTASYNLFDKLASGVIVKGSTDISSWVANNTNDIRIVNNRFKDIQMTGNVNYNVLYNTSTPGANGTAVFVDYSSFPSFNPKTTVNFTSATTSANPLFENCVKAIVSYSNQLQSNSLYLKNCTFGVMNMLCEGKPYNINNNKIENTMLGVMCTSENVNSTINDNAIVCNSSGYEANNNVYWPKGIYLNQFKFAQTGYGMSIKNNDITVPGSAGQGIMLQNTGNTAVQGNQILLTFETQESPAGNSHMLEGINLCQGLGTRIVQNYIFGVNDLANLGREDIAGITIEHSDAQSLHCNLMQRTNFGIHVMGTCYGSTKGNVSAFQNFGWLFRHNGDEGTFGIVGAEDYDNHNMFQANIQPFRVFKFCELSLLDNIYTNPNTLSQTQSGSYNAISNTWNDCKYKVDLNQGTITTYTCPVLDYFPVEPRSGFSLSEALAIATNTKTYSEFPEIAHWMDARNLYRQLEKDTVFRESNDTLNDFFLVTQSEIISQLENADNQLIELISGMESQNYELYMQRLESARETNSNIVSDELQELNEQHINDVYLKLLEFGIDSLNTEDSTFITELANQCPYIGGTAVYKARSLYSFYSPLDMFNDINICNNVGVYKNSDGNQKSKFDLENEFLRNLKPNPETTILENNDLFVYPNPATTQLNIRYRQLVNTKLQILDILGRVVKEVDLPWEAQRVSILLNDFVPGVYTYRQLQEQIVLQTGKVIISK